RSDHAPLAHSPASAAEALYAAPDDVAGRNPGRHAAGMGSVLQLGKYLGTIQRRRVGQGPGGVCAGLQTVSPDVREHRDRDRQRTSGAVDTLGQVARARGAAAISDQADAAPAGSRADDGDTAVVRVVSTNESYRSGHCSV